MKDWNAIIIRAIFSLSIPILNVIYFILDKPRNNVHVLNTLIDDYIPFNKYFIVPYILWYIYVGIFLIYFMIVNETRYWKLLICMVSGVSICYLIFLCFPTTVGRPLLSENDIFTDLVRIIYNKDKPYNCFPSIHVLHALLVTMYINGEETLGKVTKVFSNILAASIILSTMFIKQHFFMDVISGTMLAFGLYFIVNWVMNARFNSELKYTRETKKI